MCQAITCPTCGKAGWRGCGAHVEQVLGHVPKEKRCTCREKASTPGAKADAAKKGWLGWLIRS